MLLTHVTNTNVPTAVIAAAQDDQMARGRPGTPHLQQQRGAAAAAGGVSEVVSCLTRLGALQDAQGHLLLHARAGVRRMLLQVVWWQRGQGGGCTAVLLYWAREGE